MLKVYHYQFSASSRFIRLISSEYGLEVSLVREKFWERRPDFLRMNPAGTVPVVCENEGLVICGALPFMEHLYETRNCNTAKHLFMPQDPSGRAEVRRLVEWFLIKCYNEALSYLVYERLLKLEMSNSCVNKSPDTTVLRIARDNTRHHLEYLAWLVSSRNWLANTKWISFADFAAASVISVLDYLGEIDWEYDESLRQWYQKVKSRPSFRAILMDKTVLLQPPATYVDLDF